VTRRPPPDANRTIADRLEQEYGCAFQAPGSSQEKTACPRRQRRDRTQWCVICLAIDALRRTAG
jgi:hypothetical protein